MNRDVIKGKFKARKLINKNEKRESQKDALFLHLGVAPTKREFRTLRDFLT